MFKNPAFRGAATLAAICLSGPAWALGSTPVTVVNPADIAKAEGIQHPFQAGDIECIVSGFECGGSLTAPPTQRLVIEFVSASCGLNPGIVIIGAALQTFVAGGSAHHFFAAPPPSSKNLSQQVRLYADPGSDLVFSLELSGANPGGNCIFSVSGQAIAVP